MALFDNSRKDWGGRPGEWDHHVAPSKRVRRVWHWPGGPTGITKDDPHSRCLDKVASWARYHRSIGYGDIGYNFLICPHALVIEGRGRDWVGAHCPGWNREGWGIQFMKGKGETTSDEMFARAVRLAQALEVDAGHDLYDNGHREGYSTSCPGDQVQAWVDAGGPESVTGKPKPDLIAGLGIAQLEVDGYLGNFTLRAMQRLQRKRGHEIVVDGKISEDYSLLVASIQMDLNERGIRCDHRRRLVVDGKGIQNNLERRWPPYPGTTHTLEACFNARGAAGSGWLASPSDLVRQWQHDINRTTGSHDSFLWVR